jgi:hypothetical protein
VAGVLHAGSSASGVGASYGPVVGAVALLLRAGQQAGRVRTDAAAEEVLLLLGFRHG